MVSEFVHFQTSKKRSKKKWTKSLTIIQKEATNINFAATL